jgi:hypothetical protein
VSAVLIENLKAAQRTCHLQSALHNANANTYYLNFRDINQPSHSIQNKIQGKITADIYLKPPYQMSMVNVRAPDGGEERDVWAFE